MKTIHIEMICLATSYLDLYISDGNEVDSDILELYDFCRINTFYLCDKNMDKAIDHTNSICNKIQLATCGIEYEVNVLALAINAMMVLHEDDVFTLHRKLKLKRLLNSINNKLESLFVGDEAFKNSMKLIAKIIDKENM